MAKKGFDQNLGMRPYKRLGKTWWRIGTVNRQSAKVEDRNTMLRFISEAGVAPPDLAHAACRVDGKTIEKRVYDTKLGKYVMKPVCAEGYMEKYLSPVMENLTTIYEKVRNGADFRQVFKMVYGVEPPEDVIPKKTNNRTILQTILNKNLPEVGKNIESSAEKAMKTFGNTPKFY